MSYKGISLAFILLLISACGGGGGSSSTPVDQNFSPTISGSISEIRVGEFLSFLPTSNDSNGDVLTFSISGMPSWASFDTSSGLLTGTPLAENLGEVHSLTISVSDGEYTASIGPFNLTVTKPIFFLSIGVNSIDPYRNMDIELSGCFISDSDTTCTESDELLTIYENGVFAFEGGMETG